MNAFTENMVPTLKYFLLTIKHKWFVLIAGRRIGVNWWRLIKHDWSKFLPSELPHYGRQFFGMNDDPLGFSICWLKHQNRHEHHWEYWVPRTGHSRGGFDDNQPLPMPSQAVREMIADWLGASRAYEGKWPDCSDWAWVKHNLDKMKLHPQTLSEINLTINELQSSSHNRRR